MNVDRLKENVAEVHGRINDAAKRAGRDQSEITLVAVSKYVDTEATRAILEAGCKVLGESRPQQLWQKAADLAELNPTWHLIGHLQRNKVEKSLPCSQLIHSVDSKRLLNAINKSAAALEMTANVLLEINVSGDESKHGWHPTELPAALESCLALEHVQCHGLMTMAALGGGQQVARRNFAQLKSIFDETKPAAGSQFFQISMGMSGDYEIAIEEGATLVRVGSALWAGVVA